MIESELDYQNGNIGKLFRSLFFPHTDRDAK